jgi:hypothetical protein
MLQERAREGLGALLTSGIALLVMMKLTGDVKSLGRVNKYG